MFPTLGGTDLGNKKTLGEMRLPCDILEGIWVARFFFLYFPFLNKEFFITPESSKIAGGRTLNATQGLVVKKSGVRCGFKDFQVVKISQRESMVMVYLLYLAT